MTLGRELISWGTDLWSRLDQVVHDEMQRSAVAAAFLPVTSVAPTAANVPGDVVNLGSMTVDPSNVIPVVELSLGLALTQQQVDDEAELGTARTLVTRAANFLAQVEDLLIFQGHGAQRPGPLQRVQVRGSPGAGLLAAASQHVPVKLAGSAAGVYGENAFDAVVKATALLRSQGQAGPYALALSPAVYADTFVPVTGTLVMAADQIRPLVTAGFVDTASLPSGRGLLLSLGGNTMDLVMAVEPTTAFVQVADDGMYQFRVFERWALRIKDTTSMVQLEFQEHRR